MDKPEFRQPTTPAEILRLGKDFQQIRDTRGYLVYRDMLNKRYAQLAVDCVENTNPAFPLAYWQGRCAELKDIMLIVDLAVQDAKSAAQAMQQAPEFAGHDHPAFKSGTGTLA